MFEDLKKCILQKEKNSFVQALGYSSIEKGLQTFEPFLNSSSLYEWIKVGHLDFRYSAEEFVLAVVKECGFDQKPFMAVSYTHLTLPTKA